VGRLEVMHSTLQKQPDLILPSSYQSTLLKILHTTVNHELRRVLYSMLLLTDPQGILTYLNSFIREVNPKLNSLPRTINYTGLYNLGCICYMNAMMQQFFMTTELRNAILGIPLPTELPVIEVKGRQHTDNLLYQLQKMFAYLQMSNRSDYNPEGFCYSFNRNINVGVQEDSQ
jgi:ubiquitin C-terminal hydrolase